MKPGIFKPLKTRSYRSLFGAQVFSDLGNWLDFLTLQIIVVYHWGLDASAIASVIIVIGLPWVLIGPFASVFVDRLPKKTIMILSLLFKIIFVVGLYYSPNLYVLLLFVFLKGTVSSLFDPARQSAIRLTVPEKLLPEAVTLSQLSVNTMKIIGPALGGGMIALFGIKSPLVFEIIGFTIAIIFLLMMPKIDEEWGRTSQNNSKKREFWKELLEGLNHIKQTKLLYLSIIISSIALFIIFLYDGLLIFVGQKLGFNETSYGLLVSSVGLGSVVGALLLGQWTNWKNKPIHFMSSSSVISGLLIISIGVGSLGIMIFPKFIWIIGAFCLGLLASGESIPYGYVLQSETPKEMMGRVSSAAMAIQTFSMLIAPAIGALIAKAIGVSLVMIFAGVITICLGLMVLLFILKKHATTSLKAKGLEG
ncbi:MFS transporter [Bacillus sp. 31A1R]|uniref:MFS transporter n=1 Tax=Robertmurraya mangrovi TaxID=3098077 RepID=A0ABU5ITV3_9BACI|nr:MFS transporter [Bacillus sp. 31A1R]MDZ5470588.1 MFS transporter [Bacillus sp. 31A1R]